MACIVFSVSAVFSSGRASDSRELPDLYQRSRLTRNPWPGAHDVPINATMLSIVSACIMQGTESINGTASYRVPIGLLIVLLAGMLACLSNHS